MTFNKNISAVVCGASRGIGKQIALQLAQNKIRVLAVARNTDKLKDLKKELNQISALDHDVYNCDLSNSSEVLKLCDILINSNFQILICNSGGPKSGPLIEAKADDLLNAFQNHVVSNHMILQSLLPSMKKQNWGRVVNIVSTSIKIPIPNLGVSNTVRGAVAQWAKTLSLELGAYNITVNNVLPGYTETERLDELLNASSEKLKSSKSQISEQWKSQVPLQRFAQPEEVAHAVSFLCSEQANYISGINLPVDGGRTGSL